LSAKTLSIVIPAYNEERFIGALLEQIAAVDLASVGVECEILVIDDGSRDRTAEIASAVPGVRVERQVPNQGKGAAVRRGLALASGDFVIIQDADLEYDPNDYLPMLRRLLQGGVDVVYGSRYLRPGLGLVRGFVAAKHPNQSWAAYLGGRSLSLACWLACGIRITDTVTALKLFPRDVVCPLPLETTGFELDHEITARLAAQGRRFAEVPVAYFPRSRAEGKKIGFRDFLRALRTFRRYRRG
jgi:glycosyltransferase involved in cell wall biosynthesis